jgi:hypothetical protein
MTRSEGTRKNAPSQLGVLGVLPSPPGETRTTGSRAMGGGAGGGALAEELAPPGESQEGEPGIPSRSTTRGGGWCLVPVIARRAGIAGAW